MILPMSKVQILGPKKYLYDTLNVVHRLGVLQIEDMSKGIEPGEMFLRNLELDPKTQKEKSELEELLGKISVIAATVEPFEDVGKTRKAIKTLYDDIWIKKCRELADDCTEIINNLESTTRELATGKSELDRELAMLLRYESIVSKIYPLAPQLYRLKGFEAVALLVNKKYGAVLDLIREEMGKITKKQFELVSAEVDDTTIAAVIVFNKRYLDQVHNFLWAEKVNQLRLPESLQDKPFDQILDLIKKRKMEIPQELKSVKERLTEVSEEWYVRLMALQLAVQDRIEELKEAHKFAQTDFTFVVTGWLPARDLTRTRKLLSDQFGDRVIIEVLELSVHEMEEAPVVLDNPAIIKPFELIMKIFSPPRYGSIDPTPFLAVFFPILFGMIVGDIGIGLVILAVALFVRYRYKTILVAKQVTSIFIMASISTILFGVLYGEFFGNIFELMHVIREIHIFGIKFPINRLEAIIPMLLFSLAVGAVQVIFGLFLGVANAIRAKMRKHLIEKIGMLLVLFAILVIVAAFVLKLEVLMGPAFIVILIGIVALVYGAGMMGVFEIFGTLGNIFSYSRIIALGLAGAILAMVANELAGSIGSIYVGVAVALLLHLINIVVAAFSPFIHAIRLNVIEFFNQFVESGGAEYKPFKRTGGE
ncbi:MAG: V-type ATP synthase subunit I [Actinomycetota bacterium]